VLRDAAREPDRWAIEPKVDGVRGLVTFHEGRRLGTHNRRGEARQWLRGQALEGALRRLGNRLPILWHGSVLDGELVADRFAGTLSALLGSKQHGERLRYVVFDVPVLAGVDLRRLTWQERRDRLELLAQAFEPPVYLSPLVEPSVDIARQIVDGFLEELVLKDRTSPHRDGSRPGWWKVKDRSWYEREAWRFDRR
jgi:bifunctional non-homologous end joining protein LigD